jgi:iron complex transport system ATP-binding protein
VALVLDKIEVVRYGAKLLDQVSLRVDPGQVVVILGPNGAGKTTLLNAAMGDIEPDSGTVTLEGEPLANWNLKKKARKFAMLPQLSLLNFPYTAEEVVRLGRTPHSTGRVLDNSITLEALDLMDCLHLRERLYPHLSGGEKQRIQLARVFAQLWQTDGIGAHYLMLDEPTTSLDLAHQLQVLRVVKDRASANCGSLLVLHDFNLAASVADEIIMLGCGKVVASGSPTEVLTPATIERVFGASVHVVPHPVSGLPVVVG